MVSGLYSYPLYYFLRGNRQRSEFLYVSTETGLPLLYLWEASKGIGKLLTPGAEPILPPFGSAALHRSNPLVVYPKDKGGNSNYELFSLDYVKNDLKRIAGPMGSVLFTFWTGDDDVIVVGHDKKTVYARLVLRDGTISDIYTTAQQILGAAYDVQRNLLSISVGRESARLAILDVSDAKILQWIPESGIPPFLPPSVYPEKGLIAYTVDKQTHQELVVRSIESLEEVARSRIPGEGWMQWIDESHLFGILLEDGRLSPRIVDLRSREWSLPLAETSALFFTVTRDGPVWVANSFFQPPFLQALRDGQVVGLTRPNLIRGDIRVENHHYESFDGCMIQGWLLRNPDPKAPLVIYLHGGPTAIQGDWWYPEVPSMVLAGYHVFAPNYRGSEGYGKKFRDLNIGDLGGGDLQDVFWGAEYAMKNLGSSTRPALFGGSYGGYLTLQGLVTQSDKWAGGVAVAPDTDWTETYDLADAHYRGFCVHFFGGTPQDKPDLYKERSPVTHLKKLTRPVLILHGDNDNITPLKSVRRFAEAAKEMGVPVDLVITPEEGHGSLHNVNAIRDIVLTLEHLRRIFQTHVETVT